MSLDNWNEVMEMFIVNWVGFDQTSALPANSLRDLSRENHSYCCMASYFQGLCCVSL
jgi:hypothetical protein